RLREVNNAQRFLQVPLLQKCPDAESGLKPRQTLVLRSFRARLMRCMCRGTVGVVSGVGLSCTGSQGTVGGGATGAAQMGFALVVCQLSLGADDGEDKPIFAHGSPSALA
ncbi:hypothetical protein IRJ41_019219, partial [Triplophysa rosa]